MQEQTAVLKLLARQATSSTLTQTDICRTLFQMLLPNPLKEAAVWNQYLQLIVDPKAAELPWELLWDRDFEKPPVVTAGMLRQLKTTQFRQKPRETYENIACVIGDPVGTDSKPIGEFPALEGAKNEALLVTDVLRQHGYQVRDVIRQSFIQVFKAMHERGYRILHLAGHGVHEYVKKHKVDLSGLPLDPESFDCISRCLMKNNEKPVSGMVVGSIDNQLAVLGPPEVEQMLCVPELVFINCCELGAMESVTHRLSNPPAYAANIAEQFIRMGVRCVIAAGWQIDDSAARTFAEVFYDLFLQGETFGTAVRRAREETYDRHQTVNTWGAYQCYGDPGWRLVSPRDRRLMKQLELPDWTSAHDAVIGLQNFVQRAKTSVPSTATKKVAELDLIYREMNSPQRPWHQWLDRADVTGELGIAFSEVGYFNVAAKLLWNCSRLNFSKPPSTTQERLCDAFNRLAFQVNGDHAWLASFREFFFGGSHPKIPIGTNKYTEAARLLLESQRRLLTLLSLGETIELYQLLSSAFRRLAAIDQWHSTPSKTDDRNDRITLLKLAVLASNASLRLEVKREQEQARQRRTKWETSSWPEYTVVTLRVVLAILDPASIQIEPGWIPTSCSMLEVGHAVELPELAQQIAELQTIPSSNPANTTATSTTVNAAIDTDALRMVLTRDRISAWCDTMERLAKANEEQTPSFWNSSWQGGCALLRLLSELLPSKDKAQSRRQRIDDCAKLLKSGYEKAGNHGASGRERNSITQNLMLMSNLLRYANTQPGQPGQDVIRHAQQGLEQLVQYFARQWPL